MTAIGLCVLGFAVVTYFARRSTPAGLIALLAVGYTYGILRANVPETFSHFVFDAAVLGFYVQYVRRPPAPGAPSARGLGLWLVLLVAWPVLMFVVPIQDWLIQVVGLRANVLLLPFLWIGARLTAGERSNLGVGLAVLNLLAFGVAVYEYVFGLEALFPPGPVTSIIYLSRDIAGGELRIPASFPSAHAYGATMVATLPVLFGAWMQPGPAWRKALFAPAVAASLLGVFMAAARIQLIAAFVLAVVVMLSVESRYSHRAAWLLMFAAVGWTVSSVDRLQRFTTLADTEMLAERLHASVNMSFVDALHRYPMGNGLGSASSIPYFLEDRIPQLFVIENEYGRILLELGVLGLVLWGAFLLWVATRSPRAEPVSWRLGRRLARVGSGIAFGLALLGTGLFTAIPFTCLLLLNVGWIVAGEPAPVEADDAPKTPARGLPPRPQRT